MFDSFSGSDGYQRFFLGDGWAIKKYGAVMRRDSTVALPLNKRYSVHQLLREAVVLALLISIVLIPENRASAGTTLDTDTGNTGNYQTEASNRTASGNYLSFLPMVNWNRNGYFVSPTGSDTNPGTQEMPWKTINFALRQIYAGDILYIRGGIYQEQIRLDHDGLETAPIEVTNFNGEEVIVDGNNYTIPAQHYGVLFTVNGDWVEISNITISYSGDVGIRAVGEHVTLDNLFVHHNWGSGVHLQGNYDIGQNSRIWSNSMINFNGQAVAWGPGITAARYPSYVTIRNNVVWENWGEGISTFEADHIILEDNITHDNFANNIYISDATNVLCQRNLVYTDPNTYIINYGHHEGIALGDELYNPPSSNLTIINNISIGNLGNLWWWQGVQGGGMKDVLIANNTFINGIGNPNEGRGGVIISQGEHQNVRFENNIIHQDGDLPVIATISQAGVTYSHNLWSKTPWAVASGPGDIIGNSIFEQTGNPYTAEYYKLSNISPAIDGAEFLPEVIVDYFGFERLPLPDMGANEFFLFP